MGVAQVPQREPGIIEFLPVRMDPQPHGITCDKSEFFHRVGPIARPEGYRRYGAPFDAQMSAGEAGLRVDPFGAHIPLAYRLISRSEMEGQRQGVALV